MGKEIKSSVKKKIVWTDKFQTFIAIKIQLEGDSNESREPKIVEFIIKYANIAANLTSVQAEK